MFPVTFWWVMSFLFFLRFASDFFWESKVLSIIFIGLSGLFCAELFRRFYKVTGGFVPKYRRADLYLWSYFLFFSLSFLIYGGSGSVGMYAKVSTLIIAFYLGKISPKIKLEKIYVLYVPILFFVLVSFLTGNGFQYWGNIVTFSGGYYYKTDLAIALTIFSMFLLVSDQGRRLKSIVISFMFFLVFLSSSRMYLLLFVVVLIFYFYRKIILSDVKRFFILIPSALIGSLFVFFMVNEALQFMGLLSVDFFDFSSGENMQGRNLLWGNLIASYGEFPFLQQLFGYGLTKDVELAFYTGFFEGTNAHNTFIYNLVSVGVVGSVFYLLFFYEVLKRVVSLFNIVDTSPEVETSLYITVTLLFLFMIASLTATVVIFLQLSWFVFFFIGYLYNVNSKLSFLRD
jgi:hypothetical protein